MNKRNTGKEKMKRNKGFPYKSRKMLCKIEDYLMWECQDCDCVYAHNLVECPLCHSKNKKQSVYKNFRPIKIISQGQVTVNWTIPICSIEDKIKKEIREAEIINRHRK